MIRRDVIAVILAGGAGKRMGGAVKPLIVIDGARIIDRQLRVLTGRVHEVVVSGDDVGWAPVPVMRDRIADAGPLAGIAAGLERARAGGFAWVLAIAGDMPWIDPAVIDRILVDAVDPADAVVPRIGGYPEPLLAAYHVRGLDRIGAALATGQRSPSRVVQDGGLGVTWVDELALRPLDPALRSFASVNEPGDLAG